VNDLAGTNQLRVAQYGVVSLSSTSGMNLLFFVSSLTAAQAFMQGITLAIHLPQPASRQQPRSQGSATGRSQQTRQRSTNQSRAAQNQQQQTRTENRPQAPPRPAPAASCYQVLGLQPDCTKEQAEQRYQEMAMQYHSDRVAHLASEVKALAEQRMKEINVAYRELKQSHHSVISKIVAFIVGSDN
jgi:hypothetical protein